MISVVIPVYNEAESLRQLHDELIGVAAARQLDLEILFVDDGSTDASWSTIQQLAAADARVGGVRFRRNFGKAAALQAGFQAARGEFVVTLDADLQDDPQELTRFLQALDDGADVVSGWKQVRHDPPDKVIPSRVFNWLVSRVTGVALHDHNCGYKAYRREVVQELRLYGELHRFIPVLAASRGWKVGEIVVNHRQRQFGRSKYGISRNVKGFLDLATVVFLTRLADRPQHGLGAAGLVACGLGALGLMASLAASIGQASRPAQADAWRLIPAPIYASLALSLGIVLLALGLVAELVVANRHAAGTSFAVSARLAARRTANDQKVQEQGN